MTTDLSRAAADVEAARAAVASAEAALQAAQARLAELDKPAQDVADLLHSILCRANHTDQCPWGYEGDDWSSRTHQVWLDEARELIAGLDGDADAAIRVLTQLKAHR